jgi:metal-responsive CopG/Arc/MetJ family transcriptional regulator
VSVRFTEDMLGKIAELAGQSGMSRNGFIESVVAEYVQAELPTETEEQTAIETADESEVQGDE